MCPPAVGDEAEEEEEAYNVGATAMFEDFFGPRPGGPRGLKKKRQEPRRMCVCCIALFIGMRRADESMGLCTTPVLTAGSRQGRVMVEAGGRRPQLDAGMGDEEEDSEDEEDEEEGFEGERRHST